MSQIEGQNFQDGVTPDTPDRKLDVAEKLEIDRLDAIHNARSRVHNIRQEAEFEAARGQISLTGAKKLYRDALEGYLVEIRQYKDIDESVATYWEGSQETPLATVVVDPAEYEDLPTDEGLEPRTVAVIHGLDDFLMQPSMYNATFEWVQETRHGPNIERSESVLKPVSFQTLDRAVLWANEYCYKLGLDLEIEPTVDDEADPY